MRRNLPGLDRMRLQYAKVPDSEAGAGIGGPGAADGIGVTAGGGGRLGESDEAAAAGAVGGVRGKASQKPKPPDLADEVLALIFDLTFIEDSPTIRDRASFEACLSSRKSQLARVSTEVMALVGRILDEYQALRQSLAAITQINWMPSVIDLKAQLDGLIRRGFLLEVPYAHLQDYPRYLKAARERLDKLFHAAGKDQQHLRELTPLLEKWRERTAAVRAAGRHDPRLEEIRWMVEELRISLFAQRIGTAYPVSLKRIEARWRELGL